MLEQEAQELLVLPWNDANSDENSIVMLEIEPVKDAVRLKVTHGSFNSNSKMFEEVKK